VPGKAILVPTAERDGALGLSMFKPLFRGVRALMYNSFEERALIHAAAGNQDVPGVVVGIGSDIPDETNSARFRQKFGIRDRFAIYVGRIDENKGCKELFDFFELYSSALVDGMHLVLIGTPVIPIPQHPRVHHLGYVTDQDKFDAVAASELLIMPSYFESLSMVALEAWALGRPVLANAACDVLHGQCLRSNGGLFYQGFGEFFETLRTIDASPALAAALGENGRRYFQQHYSWPVIERKYTDMLTRLAGETPASGIEPLPGWWSRRRRVIEAAESVVARLPRGAVERVVDSENAVTASDESRRPPAASSPRASVDEQPRRVTGQRRPTPREPGRGPEPKFDASGRGRRRNLRGRRRVPGGR
jgi:hypothetical protein